jgi:hypothetical protein
VQIGTSETAIFSHCSAVDRDERGGGVVEHCPKSTPAAGRVNRLKGPATRRPGPSFRTDIRKVAHATPATPKEPTMLQTFSSEKANGASNAVLNAAPPADDAAARLLRHVLKVWAREQGVKENDVPAFIDGVFHYAAATILDGRYGRPGA